MSVILLPTCGRYFSLQVVISFLVFQSVCRDTVSVLRAAAMLGVSFYRRGVRPSVCINVGLSHAAALSKQCKVRGRRVTKYTLRAAAKTRAFCDKISCC